MGQPTWCRCALLALSAIPCREWWTACCGGSGHRHLTYLHQAVATRRSAPRAGPPRTAPISRFRRGVVGLGRALGTTIRPVSATTGDGSGGVPSPTPSVQAARVVAIRAGLAALYAMAPCLLRPSSPTEYLSPRPILTSSSYYRRTARILDACKTTPRSGWIQLTAPGGPRSLWKTARDMATQRPAKPCLHPHHVLAKWPGRSTVK